jgi:hypothetical protein
MPNAAPATLTVTPAVAGLGNRDDRRVPASRATAGDAWAPLRRPRSGSRPAKVGRVLVDARGRLPHRPDSDRARRGWRPTRRAERDGGTGGAAPGHLAPAD